MTNSRPPVDGLCHECGFNYDTGDLQGTVTTLIRQAAEASMAVTKAAAGPDPDVVRIRPEPEVWSAIEYVCHVRDVLEVQRFRIAQCLAEDRPVYAPMDRTGRMKEQKYEDQDPMVVAATLVKFAREFGAAARVLTPPQLGKLGLYNYPVRAPRSLGWLIRHTAHEIQHHRQDIITILAKVEPPIIPAPPKPDPTTLTAADPADADAASDATDPAATSDPAVIDPGTAAPSTDPGSAADAGAAITSTDPGSATDPDTASSGAAGPDSGPSPAHP